VQSIIEKIKRLWEQLLHQEATPHQIALGFCVGLFVSFLPIPPFQTLTTLLLAFALRSNKVAALIGLHIHLIFVPVVPFVFIVEYKIGYKLLHWHHHPKVEPMKITIMYLIEKGWPLLKAMLVGAFVLGVPSCTISYPIVKRAAFRWQHGRRTKGDSKITEI